MRGIAKNHNGEIMLDLDLRDFTLCDSVYECNCSIKRGVPAHTTATTTATTITAAATTGCSESHETHGEMQYKFFFLLLCHFLIISAENVYHYALHRYANDESC
jgi:hypothetical protein